MKASVGCLPCHNAGKQNAKWLDAEEATDLVYEDMATVGTHADGTTFDQCIECGGDEWVVLDTDDLPEVLAKAVGESLATFCELVPQWEAAAEAVGENILEAFVDNFHDVEYAVENVVDAYLGTYRDREDWAAELLEDSGLLNSLSEGLRPYFDFESYARDAEYGGDVSFVEVDAGVAVFANN